MIHSCQCTCKGLVYYFIDILIFIVLLSLLLSSPSDVPFGRSSWNVFNSSSFILAAFQFSEKKKKKLCIVVMLVFVLADRRPVLVVQVVVLVVSMAKDKRVKK